MSSYALLELNQCPYSLSDGGLKRDVFIPIQDWSQAPTAEIRDSGEA